MHATKSYLCVAVCVYLRAVSALPAVASILEFRLYIAGKSGLAFRVEVLR